MEGYSHVKDTELMSMRHELDYLRHFKQNADFGPADQDVHDMYDRDYLAEDKNNTIPEGYASED